MRISEVRSDEVATLALRSLYNRLTFFLPRLDIARMIATACPSEVSRGEQVRFFFKDFALDTDRRELRQIDTLVPLTPQMFDLLDYLLRNRERVVSKDELIASVWGGRIVTDSALTTRINAVRAAVRDSGKGQHVIRTLPRKGFRFVADVRQESVAVRADHAAAPANPALALPDKPSIAVLPLNTLQHNSDEEYISDGMSEDIITELSRFSELFVIARNSSFQYKGRAIDVRQIGRELGVRYVLEGSYRRQDGRVRIAAQLVDAQTGVHRWAERYDRELENVFAVQDELARAIATILAAHVNKAEAERTLLKPPTSWQAYDYYVRGADILAAYWSTVKAADLHESRRLLEKSLAIDPSFARAFSSLSTTYVIAWRNPLDKDYLNRGALDEAHRLASRAVQLNPNLPHAHASLGAVLAFRRQPDAAVAAFEKAGTLNPNFTDWRMAIALVYAGQSERAIQVLKVHMRLDPFYVPLAPHWLGVAHYVLGQYPEALAALGECALRAPNYGPAHLWLAATHVRLGQIGAARAEAGKVLELDPDFSIERVAKTTLAFKHGQNAEDCFDAMRSAGLPEK
jgi:adenylate cyclase